MAPLPTERSQAIDVMRGLTLALMIVVNMSVGEGKSYAPLLHATWHGLTLTDLVFPSFLFIVGTALSYTIDRLGAAGTPAFLQRVFTRTALIFLCGFLLYWFPFLGTDAAGHFGLLPLAKARIPGVLQRIALGYGLAALVLYFLGRRGALWFAALALIGYWAVLAAFGDYTLTGNVVLAVDRFVLGEAHLYGGEGIPFDPEGILSTLPAIANVIGGYFAGRLVRERGSNWETIGRLLLAAFACVVVGLAWSGVLPINKKLWTSSYVLVTIGVDLATLGALVWLLDLRKQAAWALFFEAFGRNTLFIYLLSEIGGTVLNLFHVGTRTLFDWLYESAFASWAGPKPGSLVYSFSFMLCCWIVAWWMDLRRIYVRL
jgi:predicted acyltransferase